MMRKLRGFRSGGILMLGLMMMIGIEGAVSGPDHCYLDMGWRWRSGVGNQHSIMYRFFGARTDSVLLRTF